MSIDNSEAISSEIESTNNFFITLSKACQTFFSKFIWRIIYHIKMKDYEYMSEEEIIKEFISEVKKLKLRESCYKGRRRKYTFDNLSVSDYRDIEKIAMFINNYPKLKRFLIFYRMEEPYIHWACNNFSHLFMKEKEDIINQSFSLNGNFFVLVKGKVMVRYSTKKKIGNNDDKENFYHILSAYDNRSTKKDSSSKYIESLNNKYNDNSFLEKILHPGEYFSSSIKYRGYKLSSAIALEDCDIIYLEQKIFEKIFEKHAIKAEKEKKFFIIKTMQPFKNLTSNRLELFLSHVNTDILNYDEIVYCEGEEALHIYLILHGSLELRVKEFHKISNLDKINIGKERLRTVLKLQRGDLAGVEAINPGSKYKQTLKVTSAYGIVLSIEPKTIPVDAYKKLESFLGAIQTSKEKFVEYLLENNSKLNSKLKINYPIKQKNRIAKHRTYIQYLEKETNKTIQNCLKASQKAQLEINPTLPKNILIENISVNSIPHNIQHYKTLIEDDKNKYTAILKNNKDFLSTTLAKCYINSNNYNNKISEEIKLKKEKSSDNFNKIQTINKNYSFNFDSATNYYTQGKNFLTQNSSLYQTKISSTGKDKISNDSQEKSEFKSKMLFNSLSLNTCLNSDNKTINANNEEKHDEILELINGEEKAIEIIEDYNEKNRKKFKRNMTYRKPKKRNLFSTSKSVFFFNVKNNIKNLEDSDRNNREQEKKESYITDLNNKEEPSKDKKRNWNNKNIDFKEEKEKFMRKNNIIESIVDTKIDEENDFSDIKISKGSKADLKIKKKAKHANDFSELNVFITNRISTTTQTEYSTQQTVLANTLNNNSISNRYHEVSHKSNKSNNNFKCQNSINYHYSRDQNNHLLGKLNILDNSANLNTEEMNNKNYREKISIFKVNEKNKINQNKTRLAYLEAFYNKSNIKETTKLPGSISNIRIKNANENISEKPINCVDLAKNNFNFLTERTLNTSSMKSQINQNHSQKNFYHLKRVESNKDLLSFKNSLLNANIFNNQKNLSRLRSSGNDLQSDYFFSSNSLSQENDNTQKLCANSEKKYKNHLFNSLRSFNINIKDSYRSNFEELLKVSKSPSSVIYNSGNFNLPLLSQVDK